MLYESIKPLGSFNPRSQAGATAYYNRQKPNFMTLLNLSSILLSNHFKHKYSQTIFHTKPFFPGANLPGVSWELMVLTVVI